MAYSASLPSKCRIQLSSIIIMEALEVWGFHPLSSICLILWSCLLLLIIFLIALFWFIWNELNKRTFTERFSLVSGWESNFGMILWCGWWEPNISHGGCSYWFRVDKRVYVPSNFNYPFCVKKTLPFGVLMLDFNRWQ